MSEIKTAPVTAIANYQDVKSLKPENSGETTSTPFKEFLMEAVDSSKKAEEITVHAANDKASSIDVMEAMTQAEKNLLEFKTVWDKVIQSIQELNRSNM